MIPTTRRGRSLRLTVDFGQDLKLQCKVAIKVLRPDRAAIRGTERFLEIRLAAMSQIRSFRHCSI